MKNPKVIFMLFVLLALVQLYVPAKMILDREDVLATGKAYKFKTQPIDPTDPFRGKYITLRYEDNMVEVKSDSGWVNGSSVYLLLTKDSAGFAKIEDVAQKPPALSQDYLEAKVSSVYRDSLTTELFIDYPFDRYYMEESKAQPAEDTYREAHQDTATMTYAVVSIKDGDAVLKDVMIDGVSIREIVEGRRDNPK